MEGSMNPVLKYHKQQKQQKQQRRKEAHEKQRKYEKMKQDKLFQKQQKDLEKQEQESDKDDNKEHKEIPLPQNESIEPVLNLDQIKDEKIRVPGYSQEFSKKAIEMNRAFLDPTKRKFIPSTQNKQISSVNDRILEYQAKPNEKLYQNADGVIITDEVLKIFGGKMDPSKIKIGNKARQLAQQSSTYDPFSKVTEQMNFDYIKNLEDQKEPHVEEVPITVEEPIPHKKIFLPDDYPEKKPDQPDIIIKESTVKKSKIDLTKPSAPFVPLHLQKKVQTQPIKQEQKHQLQMKNQTVEKQDDFRKMLYQEKQKPEDAFNDFMKDLEKL